MKKLTKSDIRKLINETFINEEEKQSAVAGGEAAVKLPKNLSQYRNEVAVDEVKEEHLAAMDKVLGEWAKQNMPSLATILTVSFNDEGKGVKEDFKFYRNLVDQQKGPGRVARDAYFNAFSKNGFKSEELAAKLLGVLPKKS